MGPLIRYSETLPMAMGGLTTRYDVYRTIGLWKRKLPLTCKHYYLTVNLSDIVETIMFLLSLFQFPQRLHNCIFMALVLNCTSSGRFVSELQLPSLIVFFMSPEPTSAARTVLKSCKQNSIPSLIPLFCVFSPHFNTVVYNNVILSIFVPSYTVLGWGNLKSDFLFQIQHIAQLD